MQIVTRREFVTGAGAAVVAGTAVRRPVIAKSPDEARGAQKSEPRGRRRLLYTSDPSNLAFFQSGRHVAHNIDAETARHDPARPEDLTRWVDELSWAGVDAYAQAVFSQGCTLFFRSEKFEYDARPQHGRFVPLMDHGVTPLELLIDQTHKRGMEFIAKFRMNDRHGGGRQGAKFILQNKQWRLEEFPGGLDYSFEPVRDFMFSAADEVVRRFDVNGLLFHFMRHGHCFPTKVARQREQVMTCFLRRVREMLDRRGKEKGRKLTLGVMVPQTLDECHTLGFDMPTWIGETLIDSVSPCDFGCSDFNARYEEFSQFTRKSDCHLYPTLSPILCRNDQVTLLRPENYRALAQNFYGAGADGITVFNYQYHWARRGGTARYPGAVEGFPLALSYLRELKDPDGLARKPRHYRFHPLWGGRCPTGAEKNDRLVLARGSRATGTYRFQVHEHDVDYLRVTIYVSAQALTPEDEIRIQVNRTEVTDIRRTFHPDGRLEKFGRPLPPFSTVFFDLTPSVLANGDNQLRVTLTNSASAAKGDIVIDEVEVVVLPR